jgi:hypothetical protein
LWIVLVLFGCQRETASPPAVTLHNLEGRSVAPFSFTNQVTALIFLAPDCPISNRYTTEIARLHEQFSSRIAFWVVYAGTNSSLETLRQHRNEYSYRCNALCDPELRLVKASQVRVTPEAAVWVQGKGLVYHGRIDDLFVDFGVKRPAPTRHDLQEALEAALRGQPPPSATAAAIGCPIPNE